MLAKLSRYKVIFYANSTTAVLFNLVVSFVLLEYSSVVYRFGPLLRLLPLSLSHQALLVHCAWQAAKAKVKLLHLCSHQFQPEDRSSKGATYNVNVLTELKSYSHVSSVYMYICMYQLLRHVCCLCFSRNIN